MDFFERQEKAHRNTRLLMVYFTAGVATLILMVYLAAAFIFSAANNRRQRHHYDLEATPEQTQRQTPLWNPPLFLWVSVGTLTVIGLGSLFRTMELSRGGGAVATMMGGRLVNSNSADPDERKLLNVVEEMALAS